jgi:hypothetical protein
MMDWLFVSATIVENAAHFSNIRNYPNDWELDECMPLRDKIPAAAEIRMKADFPNDIELVDNLYVGGSVLYVNERVCKLLDAQGVKNVEFLPIKVLNHKNKPVKEKYFIVNILTRVDCIDLKASKLVWNDIDPEMIGGVTKLVIDPARIPKDVKLFRPQRMQYKMLLHRTVADAIKAERLRGFYFTEVKDFQYP